MDLLENIEGAISMAAVGTAGRTVEAGHPL
jgi:hypothetical protein